MPGYGNGSFQNATAQPAGCAGSSFATVAAGEFNGDGKTDIAVMSTCSDAVHNRLTILLGAASALSASVIHTGNFTTGQTNATYTITVSNLMGALSTNGLVTVADNLPAGLSLVSMAGNGWT